jgi:hypothetical protein
LGDEGLAVGTGCNSVRGLRDCKGYIGLPVRIRWRDEENADPRCKRWGSRKKEANSVAEVEGPDPEAAARCQ